MAHSGSSSGTPTPGCAFCLDMNQGGAMIDLRPYAAKLVRPCGVGTKCLQDASYPFLVQSLYRAGYFTHYAGEGAVKSCKLSHGGEEVDLCACRTRASFSEEGDTRIVTLDPVDIEFADLTMRVQSVFPLHRGHGRDRDRPAGARHHRPGSGGDNR